MQAGDLTDNDHEPVALGEVALTTREQGMVVISLTGEHDLTTAPLLRERMESALGERCSLVVDLSAAGFIDSSIIGVVLEARRLADEKGVGFAAALDGGEPAVRRVLEVTGLDTNLPVHPDLDVAVDAARAGAKDAQ